MNLWATAAQAVVYSGVSITFGLIYKRALKRDRERLERIISGVESVFGITPTPDTTSQRGIMNIDIKNIRKAIAAGIAAAVGIIFTGLLTWLSTSGVVATLLEPIVPDQLKPVAAVIAGGITSGAAIVLAVYKTTNHPAAATAEAVAAAPVYRDVDTKTGHVDLIDLPSLSYQ